jgi:hypothetical protein
MPKKKGYRKKHLVTNKDWVNFTKWADKLEKRITSRAAWDEYLKKIGLD